MGGSIMGMITIERVVNKVKERFNGINIIEI